MPEPLENNPSHITALTALRGLAAWWVVCYHFREALLLPADSLLLKVLNGGYLAVDFFFVLSGFVIFINYHALFEKITRASLKEFIVKRIARLYPLHFVIMVMYLANPVALLLLSDANTLGTRYDATYYFASLLMVQNWGMLNNVSWNIPAWSISTEFGAYLMFPIFAISIKRYLTNALWHICTVILLCAAIWVIFKWNGYSSIGYGIPDLGLMRCMIEFAIGTVIGHFHLTLRNRYLPSSYWPLVGAILLSVTALNTTLPDYTFLPAICTLLVLYFSQSNVLLTSILKTRVLLFLGEISYSTYLVHYLLKDWVKFLSNQVGMIQFFAYAAAVLGMSVILYRFVEVPGRQWVQSTLRTRMEA